MVLWTFLVFEIFKFGLNKAYSSANSSKSGENQSVSFLGLKVDTQIFKKLKMGIPANPGHLRNRASKLVNLQRCVQSMA
jgi:hypothetical protein